MKAAPTGFWRSLGGLVVLLLLGSVAFATQHTWLESLRVGETTVAEWLEQLTSDGPPPAHLIPAEPIVKTPDSSYAPNRWVDSALYSPPAFGWTFAASKSASAPFMTDSQIARPPIVETSSALPTAFFSSGFVSYSSTGFGPSSPTSTSGIWNSTTSGNWGDSTKWDLGFIADGTAALADFSELRLANDIVVNLDTARTVGFLVIGDTRGDYHYTISGSALTFDNGAEFHAALRQSSTSWGDTISAQILMKGDLDITNLSSHNAFTIAGDISSSANHGLTLTFNPGPAPPPGAPPPAQINVTGQITGSLVSVDVHNGLVIFSGNNSYTGETIVSGGTLLVNGDQSAANNVVVVYGSGSVLGGTGTVGGEVQMAVPFNRTAGTITGGTTTTVGTLTLNGNLYLFDDIEQTPGTYLANLNGTAFSDLLAIAGHLFLGPGTTLTIVGPADGMSTYTLATFAAHNGIFDPAFVTGIPSGYDLVYHDTDIQLIPTAIPEPAAWIGSALAPGAIAFTQRRRLRALVAKS